MELNPSANYQFSRDGQQFGPVPGSQLAQLVETQQLLPGDHLWTEGMGNWLPASSFPELQALFDRPVPGAAADVVGSATVKMQATPVQTAVNSSGALQVNRGTVSGPGIVKAQIQSAEYDEGSRRKGASFGMWMFALILQFVVLFGPVATIMTKVEKAGDGEPAVSLFQKFTESGLAENIPVMIGLNLLWALGLLFCPILTLVYLYRGWKYIQDLPNPGQTPGKAVGLMLIPIFNSVWLFFAFYGWSRDYNYRNVLGGLNYAPKVSEGLFLTTCILSVLGLPLLFPFMMFQLCRAVDYLAGSEPIELPENSGYA